MLNIQVLSGIPLRETRTIGQDASTERAGILIGLKINMYSGASVLRWGYLSNAELAQRGLTNEQITKLKNKLRQAEQLYISKGGTREDFARAILQGWGNVDKLVTSNPQTLSGIGTSQLERLVLQATPQALINSLESGGGLSGDENTSEALSKASNSLSKIGGFAQSVAEISKALSSAAGSAKQGQASPNNVPDTNTPHSAGISNIITPKNIGIASVLGLGLLAVSGFNLTKEDKRKVKKAVKSRKKTSKKPLSGRPSAETLGAINFY